MKSSNCTDVSGGRRGVRVEGEEREEGGEGRGRRGRMVCTCLHLFYLLRSSDRDSSLGLSLCRHCCVISNCSAPHLPGAGSVMAAAYSDGKTVAS